MINDTTKKIAPCYYDGTQTLFRRWWNSRTFLQQRLIRFCMSMLVMIICFPLYYMGFFGHVDGPLHPDRIGQALAGMGVTHTHSMVFFLSLLIAAVSWNWIGSLLCLCIGARHSCERKARVNGPHCGAPVQRKKVVRKGTGRKAIQYVCTHGHKSPQAHFHPIKKGTISHMAWVVSLFFCLIVLFAK
jgi:hypothetical protein